MTSFVVLTDDPDKLRRIWDHVTEWNTEEFRSAAEALFWERQQQNHGAIALEGQGWRYGVRFVREGRRDGWVA